MIELWGADNCEACVEAKQFLGRTPVEWRYVDVSITKFEGEIPRIILEDKTQIIGLPAIKQYVQRWLKEQGFPEGMF